MKGQSHSITTAMVLFLMLGPWASTSQARRLSDVPSEIRIKLLSLEQDAGFDSQTQIISKPYSAAATLAALDMLRYNNLTVQFACLRLVKAVVTQTDIPQDMMMHRLRPAVAKFIEAHSVPEEKSSGVLAEAEDLVWHMDVKGAASDKARLLLLEGTLDQSANRYRDRRFAAIEYLAQIGSPETLEKLSRRLSNLQGGYKHVVAAEDSQRIAEALERVRREQGMRAQQEPLRVQNLMKLFEEKKMQRDPAGERFRNWVLEELRGVRGPEARQALRDIWRDEGSDAFTRYRAQESLIRRGDINPNERTIDFQ